MPAWRMDGGEKTPMSHRWCLCHRILIGSPLSLAWLGWFPQSAPSHRMLSGPGGGSGVKLSVCASLQPSEWTHHLENRQIFGQSHCGSRRG